MGEKKQLFGRSNFGLMKLLLHMKIVKIVFWEKYIFFFNLADLRLYILKGSNGLIEKLFKFTL